MAELRVAVVHYEHKHLKVSRDDDAKAQSIGQQIDDFIAETIGKSINSNGGPSPISDINLSFDIDEQHVMLEQFMRSPAAATAHHAKVGKTTKAY